MNKVTAHNVFKTIATAALGLSALSAYAQLANIPPEARIGAGNEAPAPAIAIGGSGAQQSPPTAPSRTPGTVSAGATAGSTLVTTGSLGRTPLPASGAGGVKVSNPAVPLPASAASGRPVGAHAGASPAPAAVTTKGRVRRLAPPVGGNAGFDSAAALSARPIPATPLDTPLPGLGNAPGTETPVKPLTVHCRPGVNEMVPIAINFPNRLDTPFADPQIIDSKGDDDNMRVGNSRFVTPNRQTPFAIWVTDSKAGTAMCSLTLIPQNIPAQNIILQMEGETRAKSLAPNAGSEETGRESQYTVLLRTLMRSVARNIAPRGFSVEKLEVGMAISNGIEAKPVKLYAGSQFDIYEYTLANRSQVPVTLSEEAFATKGVRAVAFFPLLMLSPGQKTNVFIISDRPDDASGDADGGNDQ